MRSTQQQINELREVLDEAVRRGWFERAEGGGYVLSEKMKALRAALGRNVTAADIEQYEKEHGRR